MAKSNLFMPKNKKLLGDTTGRKVTVEEAKKNTRKNETLSQGRLSGTRSSGSTESTRKTANTSSMRNSAASSGSSYANKRMEAASNIANYVSGKWNEAKNNASRQNTAKRASTGATQSASSAAKKSNTSTKTASENRQAKADIALMKQTRQQNKNQKDADEFTKEYERLTKYTVRGNAQQRDKATKARDAYEKAFQSTHSNLDTSKLKKKKMTQVKGK